MEEFELSEYLHHKNINESWEDIQFNHEPFYIGNIEYYENPTAKVVEKLYKQGLSYAVTDEGTILMAKGDTLCDPAILNMMRRHYGIPNEAVGVIRRDYGAMFILPGLLANGPVLTKGLWKHQIAEIRKRVRTLTKTHPYFKLQPRVETFFAFVEKAYTKFKSPFENFKFSDWKAGNYKGVNYTGEDKPVSSTPTLYKAKTLKQEVEDLIARCITHKKISLSQEKKAYRILKNHKSEEELKELKNILYNALLG